MYILGINTGLNASAVLMKDGNFVFGVQEERLCRVKNQPGFPALSIRAALEYAGISIADIDKAAIAGRKSYVPVSRRENLEKYHEKYGKIKQRWFRESKPLLTSLAGKGLRRLSSAVGDAQKGTKSLEDYLVEAGLSEKSIRFDHHSCHAAAAYYGLAESQRDDYLVFTMDGGGDGRTSTVSIGSEGQLKEITCSDSLSPASLYGHVTYILGFLPHEDEYKLMGLAPYVRSEHGDSVKSMLLKFVGFDSKDSLRLSNGLEYQDAKNSRGEEKQRLLEDLYRSILGVRFDTVANGLQRMAEDTAVEWVKRGIAHTGIRRVLLSGGFFMNVKVNRLIAELPEVDWVDCFPSCGDESNAFGAASLCYRESKPSGQIAFSGCCLGGSIDNDLLEKLQERKEKLCIEKCAEINSKIVDCLVEGKIVGRCSGRMEFGARALGNRSILAAPQRLEVIDKVNRAIKQRDFWMPFAPAVLAEKADLLLDLPAALREHGSPYMMFTFQSRIDAQESIAACIHRADGTARAQLVSSDKYPEFHDVIHRFYQRTGIPALLNTSLNLHGKPIAATARDAIDVLLASSLDVLVIDDFMIRKIS